ncbi:hypothetical protein ATE84_3023 [Aquimarina sp. MAR_2010_214]|uniref:hypothetical protein n=1 Tax=Aquimarina sp. MAR_2010_214 TaxID=1250026 RepID=UPI000C708984|nr:hypothetical protein [Aquimarina sp. MAR_2010_214]PKV50954.1 hypothetical protein ATE84_3023 [Aquimarina sp. MAR_2010_214]
MRVILIIALLISYISYSQTQTDLRDQLMVLVNADSVNFKLDSTGFEKLPKIDYDCYDGESGIFWHVQDLNNDGLKDLIYSGPCKPYYQCIIFLNDGTKLNNVYDSPGKLLKVQTDHLASKISILKSNCCCDYYSEFTEISIGFDNRMVKAIVEYHFDTKVSLASELKEKLISGVLRSKPIVYDNIHQDPCLPQKNIGNQILKINNEKVVVLDFKEGWYLILHKKDNEHSIIGWVKKE